MLSQIVIVQSQVYVEGTLPVCYVLACNTNNEVGRQLLLISLLASLVWHTSVFNLVTTGQYVDCCAGGCMCFVIGGFSTCC